MVFGLCANRVIGFVVAFVKDVAVARQPVAVSRMRSEAEKVSAVSRFEDVTMDEKKSH